MAQEVTIKISVQPEDGGTAQSAAAESTQDEPARPKDIQSLQLSESADAPPPLAPSELSRLSSEGVATATAGDGPAPMPIEQLQGASLGDTIPTPEPLNAITGGEAGLPQPLSLDDLEALGEDGGEGGGGTEGGRPKSARRRSRG